MASENETREIQDFAAAQWTSLMAGPETDIRTAVSEPYRAPEVKVTQYPMRVTYYRGRYYRTHFQVITQPSGFRMAFRDTFTGHQGDSYLGLRWWDSVGDLHAFSDYRVIDQGNAEVPF